MQSLLARHAMIGPRDREKASSWNRLIACLADPEVARSKPFKSCPDLPELLQLLTAAVEGNRLIVEQRDLILRGDVVRQLQNIRFRGRGSEDARTFGKQQRAEGFQISGGERFHRTVTDCRIRAKPAMPGEIRRGDNSMAYSNLCGRKARLPDLDSAAETQKRLKKSSGARYRTAPYSSTDPSSHSKNGRLFERSTLRGTESTNAWPAISRKALATEWRNTEFRRKVLKWRRTSNWKGQMMFAEVRVLCIPRLLAIIFAMTTA
jgi:hypothetical protein